MKRRMVAVFSANQYGDMVRETTEGMIEAARKNGMKLLFFVSFADNFSGAHYDRYQLYDAGDFVVYLLPHLKDYDALVSCDTYMPIIYLDRMDVLKRTVTCPVVTLGTEKEGTFSVVNDPRTTLTELIDHVVVDHGCRDIVHLAGQIVLPFVRERIQIFRDAMARHGLPCGDDRIYHGDLSPECGEAVAEEILARYAGGPKPLPDAIVCANDFMAIGLIDALEARGFQVPKDVIVTGYDDILQAGANEPSITTCLQPFTQVGGWGIEGLARLWRGEPVEKLISVPGTLKRRQSCGCEPLDVRRKDTTRDSYAAINRNMENFVLSSTNLILGASMGTSQEELFQEIEEGCMRETGFNDAVLCLIDGWEQNRIIEHHWSLKEEHFNVVCGVYRGKPIRRRALEKGQLLPEEMMADDEPYFIYPVHHLQYFMGYFIVSPKLRHIGQMHIKSWLVSVSTMLENWNIRNRLNETVAELDQLYQTDMLTGLYNRRGFNRFFEDYYEECRESRQPLAVFQIDMNQMKVINDTYGHAEGDYCLCAIANAMRACATGDEICIRTGGDEFVMLAKGYDETRAMDYIRALRESIREVCRKDGKPYTVDVSVGCDLRVPPVEGVASVQHEAEAFLHRADTAMYEEKKRRDRL